MTPEQRAAVTPQQFDTWIREAIAAKPEARNPVKPDLDVDVCVYTDPEDVSCHCLIGEVLSIHDPEVLPDPNSEDNHATGAIELLVTTGYSHPLSMVAARWQAVADTCDGVTGERPPWRNVKDSLEGDLGLALILHPA